MENCYFFHLPRELRDKVYKNVISVKHTRTPKDPEDGCRSATSRYDWNIDPTLLRVNKQIHDEASEVMGLSNDFVVIERAAEQLEQTKDDCKEEDAAIMVYNVKLWPGKASGTVNVPGERMRICLAKHGQPAKGPSYVILVEELRDFCVGLSTFTDSTGQYRLKGIEARVTIRQPLTPETPRARAERERSLLLPLAKLRFLQKVVIHGVKPTVESLYATQMTRPCFDPKLIKYTIEELISSGDSARDMGHFDVANAYYNRASDYFHHFAKHEREVFEHPADPMAFEFKILQHRALNWIEDDSFYDALEVATLALRIAIQLFEIDAPTSGPPTDARGWIKKGALRQWRCNAIKEGAERYGQRIKSEDVGRCYYYKSIAEHIVGGDKATDEAEEDKFTAIGCCVVSETVTEEENVPKELLELDARTMKRLMDEDFEDDEWEDEEGWVEEG
ncbi:hypothetical protein JMJ35_001357 [Cladonia borealis]|uniref:Uncharacterized protein n=1 Tax=Cladonia borealis TaxID=184061 RepID=A0AA39RAC8_9LECA|nr:hypothetical protein JMJ35_001357 [Cladonia borealis]